MFAPELNRSAPRIQASGSYRFATVKRNVGESGPEENTGNKGANPITPARMASEKSPTAMGRARTSLLLPSRPVAEQSGHRELPDRAADRPSCRGSRGR